MSFFSAYQKYIIILFFLFTCVFLKAQEISIPFRIGDKFGVSNPNGKMIIPAVYDIVELQSYNHNKYFIAYNFVNNSVLSSLIIGDKIILKDQTYKDYYMDNDLINAVRYEYIKKSSYDDSKNFKDYHHLYDIKGREIFKEDFSYISIDDEIDKDNKSNLLLVTTYDDDDDKPSLYFFDKKKQKITKSIFKNATQVNITRNYDRDYNDRSLTYQFFDTSGVGKEILLKLEKETIVIAYEKVINLEAEKKIRHYNEYDNMIDVPMEIAPSPILNSVEEKIILNARKIEKKGYFYYLPKKIEELDIHNFKLRKDEYFIVSKNDKQGLYSVYKKEYILPIEYDEIIFANFEGKNGGHVLKNGDKYGVYIYDYPNNLTISPIFDKMPLLVDYNYFGKGIPLFKLYDENGKFFCYTNEDGKLYYKP
ncbi:hypothetical protein [uncultured Flavobacterium sp.]|uniref:hypothetical protein n=1 Tax=uncultured Flavobacterium sp. TaxID=165435 RepID=UPI0030EF642D|tara:strand:+ start:22 stop:1284 length:1263 start_codon:yes stop_codon:yes gene_type:complete